MSKLAPREKMMIYLLILVGIIAAGVYFMVLPAINNYQAFEEVVNAQLDEEQSMRGVVAELPGLQADVAALQAEYEAGLEDLYPYMTNDQIDAMLTGLVMQYGMTPLSLSMTNSAYIQIPPYGEASESPGDSTGANPLEAVLDLGEALAGQEGDSATAPTASSEDAAAPAPASEEASYPTLLGNTVSIRAAGTAVQAAVLAEYAAGIPALSLNYVVAEGDPAAEDWQIQFTITVYMVIK